VRVLTMRFFGLVWGVGSGRQYQIYCVWW
jgi:hypothetical protein